MLGACRGALQDPSSERGHFFMVLHGFCSPPLLQMMVLSAILLPSSSPAGTSAGCGSGWHSWTGIFFLSQLCQKRISQARSLLCQGRLA